MHLRPQRLVVDRPSAGPAAPQESAGPRCSYSKKCLLVAVLLVQIGFIYGIWLLQLDLSLNATSEVDSQNQAGEPTTSGKKGVNFIQKPRRLFLKGKAAIQQSFKESADSQRQQFSQDFAHDRLMVEDRAEKELEWWCFREGTAKMLNTAEETGNFSANLVSGEEGACQCLAQWHGKDCGQPEVVWRALMTTKAKFRLQTPTAGPAHRLFHMIEGSFCSLDMLELLIKSVAEVVDYFIIFYRSRQESAASQLKALDRSLRDLVPSGRYALFHQIGGGGGNVSSSDIYKRFRAHYGSVASEDLFLYTNDRSILTRQPLRFLKYYASDMPYVRFRLKHNVYGFYWQHPERTYLTGILSSFRRLDSPSEGNQDPENLLKRSSRAGYSEESLILGDLNHASGWYCEYCQQPTEIIAELLEENTSSSRVAFPNGTRNRNVDVGYLETLISRGLHVDGQRQLVALRRYSDHYYAPRYAEENSWKFGSLLVNLFESLGEDEDADNADNY